MEQDTRAQNQNQHEQQAHLENLRDDLTWTQYITNLAANKLAPPKSQTSKVLEDYLTRLSEELYVKREGRVADRLDGDGSEREAALQEKGIESGGDAAQRGMVTAEQGEPLTQSQDLSVAQDTARLGVDSTAIEQASFSGSQEIVRPAGPVHNLNQQLYVGNRWIDVLWQFIVAQQRRIVDPERLGIEPSERMDIQIEMIRQIAASYEKLGMLTRLPDSLSEARECKVVDDIRTMALVYVARSIMDVASPKEIENEDESSKNRKQGIEFPRSVVSRYEGISPINFDPMELVMAA